MKHLTGKDGFSANWLRPAALLLVGLLLLMQASAASALTWNVQTVDNSGNIGWFTSLALDTAGNPRISYYDESTADLKYAAWNNVTGWAMESVDSEGIVGTYTSLALDAAGNPHISYFKGTPNQDLMYAAWRQDTGWVLETVDSEGIVGWHNSLALDAAGNPHISYYDSTNTNLKYATWADGTGWVLQTVDSTGSVGGYTSLALDAAGNPHISYLDSTNANLKYASWAEDTGWVLQTVDSAGNAGWFSSLALDTAGNPHISYLDNTDVDLKYASWAEDTGWVLQTVDSTGSVGTHTSLALDASGNPRISYRDDTTQNLKYAAWDEINGWVMEAVDSAGNVGWFSSLELDIDGDPHIGYLDITNTSLKYAYVHTPKAKLTITKTVAGNGAPSDWSFSFTSDLGAFTLTDESPSKVHASVTPGTWGATELNPAGYATALSCTNNIATADGNLSITLADGDDVTCTFTNTICQLGSYDTATTWACSDAQPGSYVDYLGASSAILCAPGYYQPDSGQTACLQAGPGYYVPSLGATQPTACPAGTTSPPGSTSITDCVSLVPDIYLSAKTAGATADGLDFGPDDILKWDGSAWSTWFDGSEALLTPNKAKHNINAFWIPFTGGDDVIIAFAQNRRFVPGITMPVDGTDLVWWDDVNGFTFYFDGSDVGLDKKGPEKIDGLHMLPGNASPLNDHDCIAYLLISTRGPGKVVNHSGGQLKFSGEDVLGFCATQLGPDTAGYWILVVDGSAVGLPKNATDGLSVYGESHTLYLTTNKAVNLGGGVVGGHSTVYAYDLIDQTFSGPHFSAAANGLPKQVTGLQVDGSLP